MYEKIWSKRLLTWCFSSEPSWAMPHLVPLLPLLHLSEKIKGPAQNACTSEVSGPSPIRPLPWGPRCLSDGGQALCLLTQPLGRSLYIGLCMGTSSHAWAERTSSLETIPFPHRKLFFFFLSKPSRKGIKLGVLTWGGGADSRVQSWGAGRHVVWNPKDCREGGRLVRGTSGPKQGWKLQKKCRGCIFISFKFSF